MSIYQINKALKDQKMILLQKKHRMYVYGGVTSPFKIILKIIRDNSKFSKN